MGIRIQPREIEIPEENPFEHDLLDRKEKIEVLTRLVGNVDGPCAMAVDAAWGAGKTTFLKMWAQHLRNEGFPVVEFNAWETDFTGEPFVALSSEIAEELKGWGDPTIKQKIQDTVGRLVDRGKDVLRLAVSLGIRGAAATQPEVDPAMANVAASVAENWFINYPEARKSVREFQDELEGLARELWSYSAGKPLVVFIDELDRCRPSYAIELLETGKHIFSVDHVVFVLAVNREELAKSVAVLYGDEFDAEGYLKRFFDIDFWLPEPERKKFIQGVLDAVGATEYFSRIEVPHLQDAGNASLETIRSFFGLPELSLRTIGQAIHRFGLVVTSLNEYERRYLPTLAALTVLLTVDRSLYRGLVAGALTDLQTVEGFFVKRERRELRHSSSGVMIETVIMASRVNASDFWNYPGDLENKAPQLFRYMQIADGNAEPDADAGETIEHSRWVSRLTKAFHDVDGRGTDFVGFQPTVERLDLFSEDMLRG